jgi:hypothetical protein
MLFGRTAPIVTMGGTADVAVVSSSVGQVVVTDAASMYGTLYAASD